MTEWELKKWKKKYPDIFVTHIINGCKITSNTISISTLGWMLNMYNNLKIDGNYKDLKILGLQDFGEDIKKICDPNCWRAEMLREERKEKLENIYGKNT